MRREVLRAGGLGAMLLPAVGLAAAAGSIQPSAAPRALLDLDDPEQHLRAYVRMRGSSDGSLVAEVMQGFVYALLPTAPGSVVRAISARWRIRRRARRSGIGTARSPLAATT